MIQEMCCFRIKYLYTTMIDMEAAPFTVQSTPDSKNTNRMGHSHITVRNCSGCPNFAVRAVRAEQGSHMLLLQVSKLAGVVETFYKCAQCNSCSKKILCYHRFHLHLEVLPSVNNIGKSWLAIFNSLRDWAQANFALNFPIHSINNCSGTVFWMFQNSKWSILM